MRLQKEDTHQVSSLKFELLPIKIYVTLLAIL